MKISIMAECNFSPIGRVKVTLKQCGYAPREILSAIRGFRFIEGTYGLPSRLVFNGEDDNDVLSILKAQGWKFEAFEPNASEERAAYLSSK